jgi:hypothetical protein
MEDLKGKYYSELNMNGGIITKFKINFVKIDVRDSVNHSDGSFSPRYEVTLVSENGSSWYKVIPFSKSSKITSE